MKVSRVMGRFLHYGPLLASSIIILVTVMTLSCILAGTPISAMRLPNGKPSWRHHADLRSFCNMTIFLMLSILTSYHFLVCIILGPGFVKHNWEPEKKRDQEKLQYCQECEAYKCPRSHHCRKCQRCVKKMDHHCPWINCCVGHLNHAHFIRFLVYASTGCFYGGVNIAATLVKMVFYGQSYFILLYYFNNVSRFILLVFACGVAFGVSIAVGFLLVMQIRDILRNTTNIESWIIRKAEWRHKALGTTFVYPYDLGSSWQNFIQVINMSNYAKGDGYTWPIVPGTNQYTFTEEQKLQKLAKRTRMVPHKITVSYDARCFSSLVLRNPILCCICNGLDDQYLAVEEGEGVMVSRYRKKWLYGCVKRTKKNKNGQLVDKEVGGWFPRLCAVEVPQLDPAEGTKSERKKSK